MVDRVVRTARVGEAPDVYFMAAVREADAATSGRDAGQLSRGHGGVGIVRKPDCQPAQTAIGVGADEVSKRLRSLLSCENLRDNEAPCSDL